MKKYKTIPELAKCLPPLDEEKYQEIKASMMKVGYDKAYPIVIWKGNSAIVDGHHRYKICQELGIEPAISEHSFDSIEDAKLYAIEHQINRRNLTAGQKASIELERSGLKEAIAARQRMLSGKTLVESLDQGKGKAAEYIAKQAGVDPSVVYQVKAIEQKGIPEVSDMLRKGTISAEAGDDFVRNTAIEKQMEIVKRGPEAVKNHVREIRRVQKEDRFEEEVEANTKKFSDKLKTMFGGSKQVCALPPNEMWCDHCKCAFKVSRPHVAKYCPVCASIEIEIRTNQGEGDLIWL